MTGPRERSPAPGPREKPRRSRHVLPLGTPFRLDLTVSVLRRLPTNPVDLLASDGSYLRALETPRGSIVVHARQDTPDALLVAIEGPPTEHAPALAAVRRILGTERDVTGFERAAADIPWLGPLAERMRGVKPPRYPTLWEALVNAIAFQQVSLHAASAAVRRLVLAFGRTVEQDDRRLHAFPGPEPILEAADGELRTLGLSAAKVNTLRRAAEAIRAGALDEAALEPRSSEEVSERLQRTRGVGPWTAAVVLLRGLGRLDVFPMNDSGVARNLRTVAGDDPLEVPALLSRLRPQQGMLYYHLLLARLEASGDLGRPSVPLKR